MINDCCHSTFNFSSADDTDDADFKDCAVTLINNNPCYPCHLRMKNKLSFISQNQHL